MAETWTSIIDEIIKLRHQKKMTQQDIASAAGLSQSVIARFESKKNAPQLNTLLRVLTALGCKLHIMTSNDD